MHRINITLVCFLLFTIISSLLAYKIVLTGYSSYDTEYEISSLDKTDKSKEDNKGYQN